MERLNGTADVSDKAVTPRRAVAEGVLTAPAEVITAIREGTLPKQGPLETARAAGLLAAKGTSSLIPHCHPISITSVRLDFQFQPTSVTTVCEVTARDRTGPDMEALTGASMALLTLYDIIKGTCREARIERVRLIEKSGGKSGRWVAEETDG